MVCYEATARHFAEWGKKHKEQKNKFTDETMAMKDEIDEGFTKFMEKEQMPTEDWREKRKKECPFRKSDGCELYADVVCECTGNCSWVVDYPKLKEIQDRNEQKLAEWSEEDEENIGKLHRLLVICQGEKKFIPTSEYEKLDSWLQSLHLNLKKKNEDVAKLCSNEWSEEDMKILNDIVVFVSGYADKRVVNRWVEFLKSLRPSWKPSEEQMCNLKKAYESYDFCDGERDALESLYEQLKKIGAEE